MSRVLLSTSAGEITLELFDDKSPETVTNFLQYVDDQFYNGTIFHRVIKDFMIQGGGFQPDFTQKQTRDPVKNEASNGVSNERGTVAMARTSDPHSATAQFFINVVDNPGLDYPRPDGHGYAVFGKVTGGMDVVGKIREVPTGIKDQHRDVPVDNVTIESAKRL
jgi:peptidyl-prolyl cis-trans isomerase A (cyclophilin A)